MLSGDRAGNRQGGESEQEGVQTCNAAQSRYRIEQRLLLELFVQQRFRHENHTPRNCFADCQGTVTPL